MYSYIPLPAHRSEALARVRRSARSPRQHHRPDRPGLHLPTPVNS